MLTMLHAYFGNADWVLGFIQGFIHSNLNTKSRTARTPRVKYITKVLQVWSSMVLKSSCTLFIAFLYATTAACSLQKSGKFTMLPCHFWSCRSSIGTANASRNLLKMWMCGIAAHKSKFDKRRVQTKQGKDTKEYKGMLRNRVLEEQGDKECTVLSSDPLLSQDPHQL